MNAPERKTEFIPLCIFSPTQGRLNMARYLSLLNFTQEGAKKIKDTVKRAKAFQADVEKTGGKVIGQYWSEGEFDGAVIFEVPSDTDATQLLCKLAQLGNVRTHSLRVHNAAEMEKAIAGL
jgi:uncharacterized protein with GYD domain